MKSVIERIGVVVPAHNEQSLLEACLTALIRTGDAVAIPVRIVVVLDSCTDRSAAICAQFGVQTVYIDARNVGRARATGMAAALRGAGHPTSIWLATTDADTVVPSDWLHRQLAFADAGADAVLGVVELRDGNGLPPSKRRQFHVGYGQGIHGPSHVHVHGANMGVRASAYLRSGGFADATAHEDRALVSALVGLPGIEVVWTSQVRVRTSARLEARCTEGFAHDLSMLT